MQFLILFVGVMVFVFYQFNPPPLFFNEAELAARRRDAARAPSCARWRSQHRAAFEQKRAEVQRLAAALDARATPAAIAAARGARARGRRRRRRACASEARALIAAALPRAESDDADYVFLSFVMANLPRGLDRPAAGGDPVRGDVVDRQRADRARRLHRRRLLPAQLPPERDRRPLPARRASSPPAPGACWRSLFAGVRLAGRQPDPGGEHPRLAVLRHDPGDLPGRVLLPPPARDAGVRRRRSCPRCWSSALWLGTNIGFLWFNVIGCAAVLLLSFAAERDKLRPSTHPDARSPHEHAISNPCASRWPRSAWSRPSSSAPTAKKPAPPAAAAPPRAFQNDFLGRSTTCRRRSCRSRRRSRRTSSSGGRRRRSLDRRGVPAHRLRQLPLHQDRDRAKSRPPTRAGR